MLEPRISNVLNNNLFHIITPELRTEIKLLAKGESKLAPKFLPAYEALKTRFAEFYSLPSEHFSWEQFGKCLDLTPYDLQILLGPVLRSSMADNILTADRDKIDDEEGSYSFFATELMKLSSDGQYEDPSDPEALYTFLTSTLGYSIICHMESSDIYYHREGENGEGSCIHLYMRDEQGFQRTKNSSESEDYQSHEETQLSQVASLFDKKTGLHTKIGFELLKFFVSNMYRFILNDFNDSSSDSTTEDVFQLTSRQVCAYLESRNDKDMNQQEALSFLDTLTDAATKIIREISIEPGDTLIVPANTGANTPIPDSGSTQLDETGLISPISTHMSPCVLQTPYDKSKSFSVFSVLSHDDEPSAAKKEVDKSDISKSLFHSDSEEDRVNPKSTSRPQRTTYSYISQLPHASSTETSSFWLRAMQFSLALGGVCAIIALLTCPPMAAALGLTSILGVSAAEIATTATFVAGASTLMAVSIFAARRLFWEENVPSATQNFSPQ